MRSAFGLLMLCLVSGCDLFGDSAEERQNQQEDEQKIAARETFLKRIEASPNLQTVSDFESVFGEALCNCGASKAFDPSLEFRREPLASDTYSAWGCFPATLKRAYSADSASGWDGCLDTESKRILRGTFSCSSVPAIRSCKIREKVLETRKVSTFTLDLKSWKYRRLYP